MIGAKFWDQIASKTAEKWGERLLSPALVFWAGGVIAYVSAYGPAAVETYLTSLDTNGQVAMVLGGLVIVAASVVFVENLQLVVLRLLEGYWPRPLRSLSHYLTARIKKRIVMLWSMWGELAERRTTLAGEELETFAQLDAMLATYPSTNRLLPTRLGNRLRAAEDYAWRRYGLATGVVWPRLWGVMPEGAQREVSEARGRLDAATRLFMWSWLFLVWAPWAWYWVIPLALLGMLWGYWRALDAAGVYGEMLRAVFDLHRWALYKALRWPMPNNPADEHQIGRQLTHYLWRGWDDSMPTFTQNNPA